MWKQMWKEWKRMYPEIKMVAVVTSFLLLLLGGCLAVIFWKVIRACIEIVSMW